MSSNWLQVTELDRRLSPTPSKHPCTMLYDLNLAHYPVRCLCWAFLPGSSAVVQICNALLQDVLPPATQDPNLNYICVKRITDALGVQQVNTELRRLPIYEEIEPPSQSPLSASKRFRCIRHLPLAA